MRHGLRVPVLIALLGGCTLLRDRPAVPAPSAQKGSVAVLPFRTGGVLSPAGVFEGVDDAQAGPGDHGVLAARALAGDLAKSGLTVIDPERAFGAASLAEAGHYDPPFAARVAGKVGARFAVLGALVRFRQREGSALGVTSPASVAYQVAVVRASDRVVIATDRFDYTQQSLSENLLDLPRFLKAGGRWMTREEILEGALEETAGKLATTLGATAPARGR
jgi:hypothetical protein